MYGSHTDEMEWWQRQAVGRRRYRPDTPLDRPETPNWYVSEVFFQVEAVSASGAAQIGHILTMYAPVGSWILSQRPLYEDGEMADVSVRLLLTRDELVRSLPGLLYDLRGAFGLDIVSVRPCVSADSRRVGGDFEVWWDELSRFLERVRAGVCKPQPVLISLKYGSWLQCYTNSRLRCGMVVAVDADEPGGVSSGDLAFYRLPGDAVGVEFHFWGEAMQPKDRRIALIEGGQWQVMQLAVQSYTEWNAQITISVAYQRGEELTLRNAEFITFACDAESVTIGFPGKRRHRRVKISREAWGFVYTTLAREIGVEPNRSSEPGRQSVRLVMLEEKWQVTDPSGQFICILNSNDDPIRWSRYSSDLEVFMANFDTLREAIDWAQVHGFDVLIQGEWPVVQEACQEMSQRVIDRQVEDWGRSGRMTEAWRGGFVPILQDQGMYYYPDRSVMGAKSLLRTDVEPITAATCYGGLYRLYRVEDLAENRLPESHRTHYRQPYRYDRTRVRIVMGGL